MDKGVINRAIYTLKAEELALKSIKKSLGTSFFKIIEEIKKREGNIILTGIGKSGFIAEKIGATLTSLGHKSSYMHPVEALHGDVGFVSPGDILIALSYSGESAEIVKLVKHLKEDFKITIISLTKNKKSSLGKISDRVIEVQVKDEGCPIGVAPMASTTAMLVMGDIIASALTSPEEFKKDNFARFHPGGGIALGLKKVSEVMKNGENIPMVKINADFPTVLQEINVKKLGITGVRDDKNKLKGIITDGDIRRFLIKNHSFLRITAKDIMTVSPKCISKDISLKEALSKMEKYKITTLFVIDNKKNPVGVIHIHDILEKNF